MRTRVKICGVTRAEDAIAAAEYGADAIGFVFYESSPRCIKPEVAAEIASFLPPFVSIVGLFVDADPEQVARTLSELPVDVLQFHGAESPAYCEQYDRPYIKAVRVEAGTPVRETVDSYASAQGVLLDSYHPVEKGGTGESFDWTLIPIDLPRPVILAGGLSPSNVATAVRSVRPYAVDVSSGVEISKGIKSAQKIKAFIDSVNRTEDDAN